MPEGMSPSRAVLAAILRQQSFGLEPFDNSKHMPRDIGLGGPSTEYTASEYDAEGRPMTFPTIWWDKSGNPHKLPPRDALSMAEEYESATGLSFPRHDSFGTATEKAMHRSVSGGAERSKLASIYGKR